MGTKARSKLHDTAGSSIVIALVFFLICAIIGSVVVTAASVEAKAVDTQQRAKQDELTVASAAQVLGEDLSSVKIIVTTDGTTSSYTPEVQNGKIAKSFWGKYGATIHSNVVKREDTTDIKTLTVSINSLFEQYNISAVNAKIVVGSDLSLSIDLSLPATNGVATPYSMRMLIQSVPTYDAKGNLISATYEQPVIEKQSEAA